MPTRPFVADDPAGVHAEAPQLANAGVGDGVSRRQHGDIRGRHSEARERHGDVGLAAAKRGDKLRRLQNALQARRGEAQHDLAEGYGQFWT